MKNNLRHHSVIHTKLFIPLPLNISLLLSMSSGINNIFYIYIYSEGVCTFLFLTVCQGSTRKLKTNFFFRLRRRVEKKAPDFSSNATTPISKIVVKDWRRNTWVFTQNACVKESTDKTLPILVFKNSPSQNLLVRLLANTTNINRSLCHLHLGCVWTESWKKVHFICYYVDNKF